MAFKLKSEARKKTYTRRAIPFVKNGTGDKTLWPNAKMSKFFPIFLISCKTDFKQQHLIVGAGQNVQAQ